MRISGLQERFLRLNRSQKLVGVGSFVLAISTLLPWYADLDSYKIGDQFLGVTGPASFVGVVILLLSCFSGWLFSYPLLERRLPQLPVRAGIIHLFTAIESLFLLLVVNSIYFHPKFGVNITLKESRFGMTLAFVSSLVLLVGAYLQNKSEIKSLRNEDKGRLEPLIRVDDRGHSPFVRRVGDVGEVDESEHQDRSRSFVFGESSPDRPSGGGAHDSSPEEISDTTNQPARSSSEKWGGDRLKIDI